MEMKLLKQEKNSVRIEIVNPDDTLIYPLVTALLKDEDVADAQYVTGHPQLDKPVLLLKTKKGGPLPAMTITPKKGKALAWFTGFAGITFRSKLAAGMTFTRAATLTRKAHGLGGFRKVGGQRVFRAGRGDSATNMIFARSVKIPARYQRAMPFLRPGFEEERPLIPIRFKKEIRKQLGLEEISAGLGEG